MKRRLLPILFAFLALPLTGCPKQEDASEGPAGPPPGTTLRLIVVEDPSLAQSIGYLQSEWKAQSGVTLAIETVAQDDFDSGTAPDADVVIAPSWLLGPACEAGWVLPVPQKVIQNDENNWPDLFSLIRYREVTWKGKPMAVPFGSPVPVLYYRPDLLKKVGHRTPATWKEYQELVASLDTPAVAEPLAEGWAGLTLLACSAAYATHPDNLSTLFRIDTMEPLIAGVPFVHALEKMVVSANAASLNMDPAAARAAFWQGKTAMAITWPTAADEAIADIKPDFPAGVTELPGSPVAFDVGEGTWEKRDSESDGRVSTLGVAGRVGMVTSQSPWPEPALQLLLWLTNQKWGSQVCSQSPATTLFRKSYVSGVSAWVETPMPDEAAQDYGETIASALGRRQCLSALAIPGRPRYLAALDAAVRAAVAKEKSPQEALQQAAQDWQKITEELGVDKQKAAYRASLGLK